MKTLVKFGCAAAIAGACGFVQAATSIYVDAKRGTAGGDGSWETPFATIQQALVYAQTNGGNDIVISVQPGTYDGPVIFSAGDAIYDYGDGRGYADRWPWKTISLRGRTHDVDNVDPDLVVITGNNRTNCLMVGGSRASVANICCKNGTWGHWVDGDPLFAHSAGGISICTSAIVSNCHVTACTADPTTAPKSVYGAGVFNRAGKFMYSTVDNCRVIVSSGKAAYGAALAHGAASAVSSHLVISNCVGESRSSSTWDRATVIDLMIRCGTLADSLVIDCQTTNTTYTSQAAGALLYFEHEKCFVTNCVFDRCYSKTGIIGGGFGAFALDTTITNCTGAIPLNCWGSDMMLEYDRMTKVRGCRVVGCKGVPSALYVNGALIDDCVIENNETTGSLVTFGGGKANHVTNYVRGVVIRNNKTGAHCLASGTSDSRDCRIERCWILDNVSTSASGAALMNNWNFYNCLFSAQDCVITGNTCAYGIYTGSKGERVASDWPYDSQSHVAGCTVADNTFSKAAIQCDNTQYDSKNILDRVTFTNCLVGANGSATAFNANFKGGPVGAVAYSMAANLDNLPTDATGAAHNVCEAPAFLDGGYRPKRTSSAVGAGIRMAYMSASDCKTMGDGTVEVTYVGAGVRVAAGDTRSKRSHARIQGTAPDIGACEYFQAPGLMLLVR